MSDHTKLISTLTGGLLALSACGANDPCPETPTSGAVVGLSSALGACNHVPKASISGMLVTTRGKELELTAQGSTDEDGDTLAYAWSIEPPVGADYTLMELAGGARVRFMSRELGLFTVRLVVSDGGAFSEPAEVSVKVNNGRPIANAGADVAVELNELVTLDGSASEDPDPGGTITEYRWALVEQPAGSRAELSAVGGSPIATFTPTVRGVYRAQLVVSDGVDTSEADELRVGAGISGDPPIARITVAGPEEVGSTLVLDASRSFDPESRPLTYEWELTNKPDNSTALLTRTTTVVTRLTPDLVGDYQVKLVVSDGWYESNPVYADFKVGPTSYVDLGGTFDSDKVYIIIRYDTTTVEHLIDPEARRSVAGYFERAGYHRGGVIRPSDGRLVYVDQNYLLREFVPDVVLAGGRFVGSFPGNSEANDLPATSLPCNTRKVFAAGEHVWVSCLPWTRTDGKTFAALEPTTVKGFSETKVLVFNNLLFQFQVSDIDDPNSSITVPAFGAMQQDAVARRSKALNAWLVAADRENGEPAGVWSIDDDGNLSFLGAYPLPNPSLRSITFSGMDGMGTIYASYREPGSVQPWLAKYRPGAREVEPMFRIKDTRPYDYPDLFLYVSGN